MNKLKDCNKNIFQFITMRFIVNNKNKLKKIIGIQNDRTLMINAYKTSFYIFISLFKNLCFISIT